MFSFPDPTADREFTPEERDQAKWRGLAGVLALITTALLITIWVLLARPNPADIAAQDAEDRASVVDRLAALGVEAAFIEEVDGPRSGDRYRVLNACDGPRSVTIAWISDDLMIARAGGEPFEVLPDTVERLTAC